MVDDHHKGINDSWATERFGCSRTAYINVFEDIKIKVGNTVFLIEYLQLWLTKE